MLAPSFRAGNTESFRNSSPGRDDAGNLLRVGAQPLLDRAYSRLNSPATAPYCGEPGTAAPPPFHPEAGASHT